MEILLTFRLNNANSTIAGEMYLNFGLEWWTAIVNEMNLPLLSLLAALSLNGTWIVKVKQVSEKPDMLLYSSVVAVPEIISSVLSLYEIDSLQSHSPVEDRNLLMGQDSDVRRAKRCGVPYVAVMRKIRSCVGGLVLLPHFIQQFLPQLNRRHVM
jgi:hypothetical protein